MARRHLMAVARKALGLKGGADDSDEPIAYWLAFWGFWACMIGCMGWYLYYKVDLVTGLSMLFMIVMIHMVAARIVCQAGVYQSPALFYLPEVVQSSVHRMGARSAVVACMQNHILGGSVQSFVAPLAMNCFRIAEVFGSKRRLLFPILLLCLPIALICSTFTTLNSAYGIGAMNFFEDWAYMIPQWAFGSAQYFITQGDSAVLPHHGAMAFGFLTTGFVMFMRARFYWWPVHPVGLLVNANWFSHRLWIPFFLGWLCKTSILKFGGGRRLKGARDFFIALVIVEGFIGCSAAVVRWLADVVWGLNVPPF